jgi:hypothetical protein
VSKDRVSVDNIFTHWEIFQTKFVGCLNLYRDRSGNLKSCKSFRN